MDWREANGLRWLEAELPGARAAFSTRLGGASAPPFDSLNLGVKTDDRREEVAINRGRLATTLGLGAEGILMGHQVHGVELAWHERAQRPAVYADCEPSGDQVDAEATAVPGLTPLVLVADCLPVALVGPGGVAIAHAGRRGLAGGIIALAAARVQARAAAIGPGIGPCCYEVGDQVLAEFAHLAGVATGRMLDLPEVASAQLAEAGVTQIYRAELCTSCNPELFFSHRRDGERTGRQAGLAWLER